MSIDRCFSIVGDSNVRRFVTNVNRRACPELQNAQISSCGKIQLLEAALEEVNSNVDICIVSCVSNFIESSSGSDSSVAARVDPTLTKFRQILVSACLAHESRQFFVCPPMYRSTPSWYRDGMPDILTRFSAVMSKDRPENLRLLPSFPSPSYEKDGVHLTPYAGLEFLYHMFDSVKELLSASSLDVAPRCDIRQEIARCLGDRVTALEQDHRRLNTSYESKFAIDSELADFQENVRNEVFFVICGLPRIPSDLRGKDWQQRAITDVRKIIRALLDKDLPVVVVQNVTGRASDAEVRYHVKMECAAHSQEIRSKFGSFFIGGEDRRPAGLRSISISNRINQGTQIRISILKLMGKKYLGSNPGSKVKVIGFEARPVIRITPPVETRKRPMTFTFIEAVSKLRLSPTSEELCPIVKRASSWFPGKLRQMFVVLPDEFVSGSDIVPPSSSPENNPPASEIMESELESIQLPPPPSNRKRSHAPDLSGGSSSKQTR